jgi:hypothetical protein
MLFPTHLVAGYLCTLRWNLAPLWTVAGAALPDLIDKPVAMLGLYGLYHSLGHSLLSVVALALATFALDSRAAAFVLGSKATALAPGPKAAALGVGWGSHLLLDAVHVVANGRPGDVRFLAWPFVQHTPAVSLPPVEFAAVYLGTPSFYLELFLWGVLAAVVVERRLARRRSGG